ncbi:MAG: SCO family protein [Myxococcota bacterium]
MHGRTRAENAVRVMTEALAGWAFPVFLLTTLFLATGLMAAVTLLPMQGTPMEQFAEEFKVWCFGFNPSTGEMNWSAVITTLTGPVILGGVAAVVWWQPLREVAAAAPRRLLLAAGPAVLLVGSASVVTVLSVPARAESREFPAEALRVSHTPPAFTLTDQRGESVSLTSLRGRVVVITGVYSTCATACPMIVQQAKGVIRDLPAELAAQVSVLGVSLDPERDTPESLARMATLHRVSPPQFYFLGGEPTQVNTLLDSLGFERRRNPQTGTIDHASMYIVVDKTGRIAYRFGVGETQRAWMGQALRLLVQERGPSA